MSEQLQRAFRDSRSLTSQELERSLDQAAARNVPLCDYLVLERNVPDEAVAEAFSRWLKVPFVRLASIDIESAAVKTLPGWLARKHTCLPVRLTGKTLVLAMANPVDRQTIQDLQFASSRLVQPVVAARTEILHGIEQHYGSAGAHSDGATTDGDVFRLIAGDRDVVDFDQTKAHTSSDETPVVQLVSQIMVDAIKLQSSDIHIEPGREEVRVRLRVDGVLRDYSQLPRWMNAGIVSRIKILAKLDIARQRVPQDGRIKVKCDGRGIDVRVSTLPTHFGEKVVLRLLGLARTPSLDALGLSGSELEVLDDTLSQPQGLILVTGPTGAGKSTTLYSMLLRRQSPEVNIVTIEDPIEYQVPGANQVQVDVRAGLTFASCLRSILRQDPDVIMVGEIRDLETAEIAFQAALTGHLVFSSLHTNGTVATIERLLDLGVKPLVIASATNLIVAQRLARRICASCREPHVPLPETLRKLRIEGNGHEFSRGRGCAACGQTGYSGRAGIFEILRMTPAVQELVGRRATRLEICRATSAGTRFLIGDALEKARQGITTPEEILRVIRIDDADEIAGGESMVAADGRRPTHPRRQFPGP